MLASFAAADAALIINGNFCSVAQIQDAPAGINTRFGQWNDFTNASGQYAANDDSTVAGVSTTVVSFSNGTAVNLSGGFLLEWTGVAQDTHDQRVGDGSVVTTGDEQLFAGYLSAPAIAGSAITLAGTGVKSAFEFEVGSNIESYDVYLYIDGESDGSFPEVSNWEAELTGGTGPTDTFFSGMDADDFILLTDGGLGDFAQVTATSVGADQAGNYVKFSGITSDNFEVTLTGVDHGIVLNGFEIVAIPEPSSSLVLGGLLALSVLPVRRRK